MAGGSKRTDEKYSREKRNLNPGKKAVGRGRGGGERSVLVGV